MPLLPSYLLFTVAAVVAVALFIPNLLAGLANGIRYGDLKTRLSETFADGAQAILVFGNSAYANPTTPHTRL